MKQALTFGLVLVLLASCAKQSPPRKALEGTWKLIEVFDSGNPYLSQPPGDILLTFSANGTYYGHTLANTFSDGKFVVEDSSKITFDLPRIQTQVTDEEWGRSLFTTFASCVLQSVHPCRPCIYTIKGNELFIDSPMRYDLVFRKL